ncbi:Hypothetical protein NocV09_00300160 [Nannochloropsis oceanica]
MAERLCNIQFPNHLLQQQEELQQRCIICLDPQESATATGSTPNYQQCPIGGHIVCHKTCLDSLVLFNVSPERLRAYHGEIPCPWVNAEQGRQLCPQRWHYRELATHLSPDVQLRYVEGVTTFMRTLLGEKYYPNRHHLTEEAVQWQHQKREDPLVEAAAAHIVSDLLSLHCPSCATVFADFDACCAVTCGACGTHFCGLCLDQPGGGGAREGGRKGGREGGRSLKEQAHAHVIGVHGQLFFQEDEILRQQNIFRMRRIVEYLLEVTTTPSSVPPSVPPSLAPDTSSSSTTTTSCTTYSREERKKGKQEEESKALQFVAQALTKVAKECAALEMDVREIERIFYRYRQHQARGDDQEGEEGMIVFRPRRPSRLRFEDLMGEGEREGRLVFREATPILRLAGGEKMNVTVVAPAATAVTLSSAAVLLAATTADGSAPAGPAAAAAATACTSSTVMALISASAAAAAGFSGPAGHSYAVEGEGMREGGKEEGKGMDEVNRRTDEGEEEEEEEHGHRHRRRRTFSFQSECPDSISTNGWSAFSSFSSSLSSSPLSSPLPHSLWPERVMEDVEEEKEEIMDEEENKEAKEQQIVEGEDEKYEDDEDEEEEEEEKEEESYFYEEEGGISLMQHRVGRGREIEKGEDLSFSVSKQEEGMDVVVRTSEEKEEETESKGVAANYFTF